MSGFDVVGFGALNVDKLFRVNRLAKAEEELIGWWERWCDSVWRRARTWRR